MKWVPIFALTFTLKATFGQNLKVEMAKFKNDNNFISINFINNSSKSLLVSAPIYNDIEFQFSNNDKWEVLDANWFESLILKFENNIYIHDKIYTLIKEKQYSIATGENIFLLVPINYKSAINPLHYRVRYNKRLPSQKIVRSNWLYLSF